MSEHKKGKVRLPAPVSDTQDAAKGKREPHPIMWQIVAIAGIISSISPAFFPPQPGMEVGPVGGLVCSLMAVQHKADLGYLGMVVSLYILVLII